MPHVLIIGMVESGKTTLAQRMSISYSLYDVDCVVLDPMLDKNWSASLVTDDPDFFLDELKRRRSCAVFIDESGDNVGLHDKKMHWTATKSRHYGHNVHYIAQRTQQIAPVARNQCSRLFLFNVSRADSKILGAEWGRDEIDSACELRRGEYFDIPRFGDVKKNILF